MRNLAGTQDEIDEYLDTLLPALKRETVELVGTLAARAFQPIGSTSTQETEELPFTPVGRQSEASHFANAGALDELESSPAVQTPRNRRGRPANLKQHRAIATVIAEYANEWKHNLPEITKRFDADGVEPRKTDGWKETWTDTLSEKPDLVKKAIQDSLNAAKKYH